MAVKRPEKERFEEKFIKMPSGCWEWTACTTNRGYGEFRYKGKNHYAHRASWLIYKGDIPKLDGYHGACVCHSCDNRKCVNPDHLFIGTNTENILDSMNKRRWRGTGIKILTEKEKNEIRSLKRTGLKQCKIAKIFSVSQTTISQVVNSVQ